MSINFDPNQSNSFDFTNLGGLEVDNFVITLANISETEADIYIVASTPWAAFRIELHSGSLNQFNGFTPAGPFLDPGAPQPVVTGTGAGASEPMTIELQNASYSFSDNSGAPIFLGKLSYDATGLAEVAIDGHVNATMAGTWESDNIPHPMVVSYANVADPSQYSYSAWQQTWTMSPVAVTADIRFNTLTEVGSGVSTIDIEVQSSRLMNGFQVEIDPATLTLGTVTPSGNYLGDTLTLNTATGLLLGYDTGGGDLWSSIDTWVVIATVEFTAPVATDNLQACFSAESATFSYGSGESPDTTTQGSCVNIPRWDYDYSISGTVDTINGSQVTISLIIGDDVHHAQVNVLNDDASTDVFVVPQPAGGWTRALTLTAAEVGWGTKVATLIPVDDGGYQLGDGFPTLSFDMGQAPANNPPVITITGDNPLTINHTPGASYTDAGATADDGDGTDITASIAVSGDVPNPGNAGTYTVTYTVTDDVGQSVSTNRTVHVTLAQPEITSVAADPSDPQGQVILQYRHGESFTSGDSRADSNSEPSKATIYRSENTVHPYDAANDQAWVLVADNVPGNSSGGASVTWLDTDVNPGESYRYKVVSKSDDYESSIESAISSPLTIAPMDTYLEATSVTVDGADIPSVTIAWGTNIESYNFSLTNDADGTEYFGVLNNDTTGDSSPHSNTASNNLPAGDYSWSIAGTDSNGDAVSGNSGNLTIVAALEFQSVAVTADALPWSMANVRWGLPVGVNIPSDMNVQIERKQGSNGAWAAITSNQDPHSGGLNGSSGTGYTDTGLTPATVYYYRLIFVDTEGSQSPYSVELEYATIAIPTLATADVNTRGNVHPILTVTGAEIDTWYWTTEAVSSPEARTKAQWAADANAHEVTGAYSVVMDHLGSGAGNSVGEHASGAYVVTVAGFWHDGTPLAADMTTMPDPSEDNTILAVPYNVFSGAATVTSSFAASFQTSITVSEPNDAYDWEEVRWSTASPASAGLSANPGTDYSSWGTVSADGNILAPDPVSAGTHTYYIVPISDENDERIGPLMTTTVQRWAGLSGVSVTVNGNNLASDNVTITASPAGTAGPQWRYSIDVPPPNGDLGNWGVPVDGNTSSVTITRKVPGSATCYAVACFPDGTRIGYTATDAFSLPLVPYTGLTELKLVAPGRDDDATITLEAYGYFPQWRYYIGILPMSAEANTDMDGDPHGTAVDEDPVILPDGEPSRVGVEIETNRRVVVYGVATDGQYLIGKTFVRIIHLQRQSAEDEWKLRREVTPATFDENAIPMVALNTAELDDNGDPIKRTMITSTATITAAVPWLGNRGLVAADVNNFLINTDGNNVRRTRSLEDLSYITPPATGSTRRLDTDGNFVQDDSGNFIRNITYADWSNDDGVTAHLGVDMSAELASNFAGVDNALATAADTANNYKEFLAATSSIDLTGSSTGTLSWPDTFVKFRLREMYEDGVISRDAHAKLQHGSRNKDEAGGSSRYLDAGFSTNYTPATIEWKQVDISTKYPNATVTGTDARGWDSDALRASGENRLSARDLYDGKYFPQKLRKGGAVATEDFHERIPRFPVTTYARPDTSMSRTPPTRRPAQQANAVVIDMVNDRSKRRQDTSGNTTLDYIQGNASLVDAFAFLNGPTLVVDYGYPSGLDLQVGVDPQFVLFEQWSAQADSEVPREILSRYMHFGNAPTEASLQLIYDLEKTADADVPGSGRNRTEWKADIVSFATKLGVSITE